MKSLAIIPARGGSKRIPRKNIREFCGKPIIAYSIESAQNTRIFDEIMVSTDDEEIAEVARKYGASVPFMRSEKTANDQATVMESVYEVIDTYRSLGQNFDICATIYATAPFVTAKALKETVELLIQSGCDGVMPIVQYGYPPQRSLSIVDGKIVFRHPEHVKTRSQDLEPIYHDSGLFDCFRCDSFLEKKTFFTDNTLPIILPESMVQDIDTEEDWAIAELKYRIMHHMNKDIW